MELTDNPSFESTEGWGVPENPAVSLGENSPKIFGGGPPPNRAGKLDDDARAVHERPRRFGRRIARREFTRRRLHRITPEALASGEVERRLERRAGRAVRRAPARYFDVIEYVVTRGWTTKRSEARAWMRAGKINVNGSTWAYPHYPLHELDHDKRGLPRIMVEGEPDPRRLT